MRRILLSALVALTLGTTLGGCFAHEREYGDRREHEHEHEGDRERAREEEYRDRDGHAYRRQRWHDEDVYQREDGRWYTRRNNDWVLRADVVVQ